MNNKQRLLVLCIPICNFLGVHLITCFYLDQQLCHCQTSDQELIELLFETEGPCYDEFKIVESDGEGIRRIPRELRALIDLETFPDDIQCEGII